MPGSLGPAFARARLPLHARTFAEVHKGILPNLEGIKRDDGKKGERARAESRDMWGGATADKDRGLTGRDGSQTPRSWRGGELQSSIRA